MGNKESVIGIGILAIAAYLWFRNKGDNSIPANNPIKQVEFRNLQKQEQFLTKELETDFIIDDSRIRELSETISVRKQDLQGVRSGFKIEEKEFAAAQRSLFNSDISKSQTELDSLRLMLSANLATNIKEATGIINTQNWYNSSTLNDIRQRLNSSEFSGF